jgi:hypothetical protein
MMPKVEGPGREAVDLIFLADFVAKSDKDFDAWVSGKLSGVKMKVSEIKRPNVVRFSASKESQKKLFFLQIDNRPSFEEFFGQEGLYGQPKDKSGKPLDDHPDRVMRWQALCNAILRSVPNANNDEVAALDKKWDRELKAQLNNWLTHYEGGERSKFQKLRQTFKPLAGTVTIVVTELSSPAYGEDGKRYDVTLARPVDQSAGRSRLGTPQSNLD